MGGRGGVKGNRWKDRCEAKISNAWTLETLHYWAFASFEEEKKKQHCWHIKKTDVYWKNISCSQVSKKHLHAAKYQELWKQKRPSHPRYKKYLQKNSLSEFSTTPPAQHCIRQRFEFDVFSVNSLSYCWEQNNRWHGRVLISYLPGRTDSKEKKT